MEDQERQQLHAEISRLKQENELLKQKLDLVLRKLFGKSSEQLDPAQLELLLDPSPGKTLASLPPNDAPEEEAAAPNAVASPETPALKPHRPRLPEHLPIVEETLLPAAAQDNPADWRRIGEEHSDRLDYQPAIDFLDRTMK